MPTTVINATAFSGKRVHRLHNYKPFFLQEIVTIPSVSVSGRQVFYTSLCACEYGGSFDGGDIKKNYKGAT